MECSVCYYTFDGHEHRPRTLPCGHTFCTACIKGVVDRISSTARCPSCRAFSLATSAEEFPVSYIAEALMTQLEKVKLKRGAAGTEDVQESVSEGEGEARVVKRRPLQKKKKSKAVEGAGDFVKDNSLLLEEIKATLKDTKADVQKMQCQLQHYQSKISEWKAQHLSYQVKLRDLMGHNSLSLELLGQEDSRVTLMRMRGRKLFSMMESRLEHTNNNDSNHDEDDETCHCVDIESIEAWTRECQMTFPNLDTATYSLRVSTVLSLSKPFHSGLP